MKTAGNYHVTLAMRLSMNPFKKALEVLSERLSKKPTELSFEVDSDIREEYGDEFAHELAKWEHLGSISSQFLVVYSKGKSTKVDVVELDPCEIIEGKKPYVRVNFLLPKKTKHPDFGDIELEWEKESWVKSTDVFHVEPLARALQSDEFAKYELAVKRGEKWLQSHSD